MAFTETPTASLESTPSLTATLIETPTNEVVPDAADQLPPVSNLAAGDWCYKFDFTQSARSDYWALAEDPNPSIVSYAGEYVAGQGYKATNQYLSNGGIAFRVDMFLPSASAFTAKGYLVDVSPAGIGNYDWSVYWGNTWDIYTGIASGVIDQSNRWPAGQPNMTHMGVFWRASGASPVTYLKRFWVYGTGSNPFGQNDCLPTPTPTPTRTPTATPTPTSTPDITCSATEQLIDLIPASLYPSRSVSELVDMGVTNATGIYSLRGPTINAKQSQLINWGTKIKVYARVSFPQSASNQIWYHVSLSSQTSATGWIVVLYESKSYLQSSDPCAALYPTPPANLTFAYNRSAVRYYVIPQSYANNGSSPGATRVSRKLTGVRYANFDYSDLNSQAESTGSAIFVSEGIWMGGMPMTIGAATSCKDVIYVEGGWRYCWQRTEGGIQISRSSSTTWEVHKALGTYYTTGSFYIPSFSVTNTILSSKGSQLPFPGSSGNPPTAFTNRLTASDISPYIGPVIQGGVGFDIKEQEIDSFARLYLGSLQAGDYIWIDPSPTPHGLIIVGWYSPIDCEQAKNSTYGVTTFSIGVPSASTYSVPWVTDFGNAQNAVPRPFYCTRYDPDLDSTTGFAVHDWRFYTIPNSVSIPFTQLYVDQYWQW